MIFAFLAPYAAENTIALNALLAGAPTTSQLIGVMTEVANINNCELEYYPMLDWELGLTVN